MALCWWYVSAWPSGRRNEGMQPYSPPPPCLFGSYDGLGWGAVFLCDVDAGCPWRSKVVMGASVHQSRNAAGRAKPKQTVM